jgi:hypothetical protein
VRAHIATHTADSTLICSAVSILEHNITSHPQATEGSLYTFTKHAACSLPYRAACRCKCGRRLAAARRHQVTGPALRSQQPSLSRKAGYSSRGSSQATAWWATTKQQEPHMQPSKQADLPCACMHFVCSTTHSVVQGGMPGRPQGSAPSTFQATPVWVQHTRQHTLMTPGWRNMQLSRKKQDNRLFKWSLTSAAAPIMCKTAAQSRRASWPYSSMFGVCPKPVQHH